MLCECGYNQLARKAIFSLSTKVQSIQSPLNRSYWMKSRSQMPRRLYGDKFPQSYKSVVQLFPTTNEIHKIWFILVSKQNQTIKTRQKPQTNSMFKPKPQNPLCSLPISPNSIGVIKFVTEANIAMNIALWTPDSKKDTIGSEQR